MLLSGDILTIDPTDPKYEVLAGEAEPAPPPPLGDQPNVGDTSLPEVFLTVLNANATEGGDSARIEFRRSGPTTDPLIITYAATGTAQADGELQTVVIEAGEDRRTVSVEAIDDDVVKGTRYAHVYIEPQAHYVINEAQYTGTIFILDDDYEPDMPTINVVASRTEGTSLNQPQFTFVRTGSLDGSVLASFSIGGSAVASEDYESFTPVLFMADGISTATLVIEPLATRDISDPADLTISLHPGESYSLGQFTDASVSILPLVADELPEPEQPEEQPGDVADPDETTPEISIAATQPTAVEDGPTGIFTVTRTGNTDDALTVAYLIGGDAQNGSDYQSLTGSVTITAGESSAQIAVTPIDDADPECTEIVQLTLDESDDYALGSTAAASVRLLDNDHGNGGDPGTLIDFGDDAAREVRFTDANGNDGSIRLIRGSGALQVFGDNVTLEEQKNRVIVHGDNVRVHNIHVDESDARTALLINGKGVSNLLIGQIHVDGDMRILRGRNADILCEIWIGGSLRQLHFGSTVGDQTLISIGSGGMPANIKLENAHNLVLQAESELKKVLVSQWTSDDNGLSQITAPSMLGIISRGDFSADVRLTDADADQSLRIFNTRGRFSDGGIYAASNLVNVRAAAMDNVRIMAGISAGTQNLPTATSQFINRGAEIRNVRANSFTDSVVAAWNVGKTMLREVEINTSPTLVGMSAHNLRGAMFGVDGERERFNARNLSGSLPFEQDNFQLRLVG